MTRNKLGEYCWSRAVKIAKEKRDGKPHAVEMFESLAPGCGRWFTVFVDGRREVGAKLIVVGEQRCVRCGTIVAEGGAS